MSQAASPHPQDCRRDHRHPSFGFSLAALFAACLLFGNATKLCAQLERPPELGGRTSSLSQPKLYHYHAGLSTGAILAAPANPLTLQTYFGVSRHLLNPVAGLASIGVEAYAGVRDATADGGARLMLRVPYILAGAGLDYNIRDGDVAPLITIYGPVRRGGIIVPGGLFRADVYPSTRSFTVGVSVPLADPLAGRGRPIRDHVVVAGNADARVHYQPLAPVMETVFDSLRVSAEWIRRLVVPYLDQDGRNAQIAEQRTASYVRALRAQLAKRSVNDEVRHFHMQLEHAFTLAAGEGEVVGRALTAQARGIVLEEMLLPYNRLLGRKKRRDTLENLATAARGRFSKWVTSSGMASAHNDDVLLVFQRFTELLDDVRRTALDEWNDARLVWLPLQYTLLPEQHDEQVELDELLARATAQPFTEQNRIRYVANLQFHSELLQSIGETQNYHVLWVHDFPAVTSAGELDWASAQVVTGYLTALAQRVEAYDSAGTLPAYFIFLDEFYYQVRRSRILMTILEDPLAASANLPRDTHGNGALLEDALERLRRAVRDSRVLRAEARQYGDAWLRNRIKVHVSVTNRADPSFVSGSLIGTIFGYPDNVMRDHRKVAFRDVGEANAHGQAIMTGMGVGQQYLGAGWEDRSLIVQGPALLALKRAATEMLLSQGMLERDLPLALRVANTAIATGNANDDEDDDDYATRALLLVNGTGFLSKPINVAKALLYSLMPAGSVLKIPDSLWNSTFFGGLLAAACARGVNVSITAPALANAPSAGFPQMARAHELLTRLLLVRVELADAIAQAGGELRIGMYAIGPDRNGFASRAQTWTRQTEATPPTRALMPATARLIPVVAAAAAGAEPDMRLTDDVQAMRAAPKLHQKVQYLATAELWEAIGRSSEWEQFMATYLEYRKATYAVGGDGESELAREFPGELSRIARRLFTETHGASRVASYALVGSQNMDYRGMFMDGEVGVMFGGADSLVPLLDLLFLEGTVTWLDDQRTLDRLLPPPTELQRRLGRLAKDAM